MDKQTNPKVSIIVPVYKVEKYLPQCIESLTNQTYRNIEIILVNDGSPDNSGKICDEYAANDKRITVIHQKNCGLSGARNNGIKRTSGDFIMFLDSDDWLSDETCEKAIEVGVKNQADIVFWNRIKEFPNKSVKIQLFSSDLIFENERKNWLHRRLVGLLNDELENPTQTDAYNSAWGKLYRRRLIVDNRVHFINTNIIGSEDVLFNIEAFWFANRIVYLNLFLSHYRQDNPNALTKNHGSTLTPRFLNLFQHIQSFIEKNNLPIDYKDALYNRISLSTINNVLSISSPNNNETIWAKRKAIKIILSNKLYKNAFKNLRLAFLPIHWKLFFLTCRFELTLLVFMQGRLMIMLKNNNLCRSGPSQLT